MKNLLIGVIVAFFLSSCAESKTFEIDGKQVEVQPYGWANEQAMKNDKVEYQVCFGNIVWDIIGFETIIIPIYCTGWEFYEPVKLKEQK